MFDATDSTVSGGTGFVPPEDKKHRYTKAERIRIRDEFVALHGGVYHPHLFIEAATDPEHPAHDWFEWDDECAGYRYRLVQARAFVRGLPTARVVIQEIEGTPVTVKVGQPSYISALSGRANGGGYREANDDKELIRQAHRDLKAMMHRHEAALVLAHALGEQKAVIEKLAAALGK